MKKKNTLLNLGMMSIGILPILTSVACGDNALDAWDTQISIQAKPHSWGEDIDMSAFKTALENEVNANHTKDDISITIDIESSDNDVIAANIESKKYDLGFSSITSLNKSVDNKNNVVPHIQTTTNAFTFDPDWSVYVDGGASDPLIKIGNDQTIELDKYESLTGADFNGSIYEQFYDLETQVDFYRGMVMIEGDAATITSIRAAWDSKNWEDFRSFGIMHGGVTSGGTFLLQERLFKKHFGDGAFTSLSEEKIAHANDFVEGDGKDLGNDSNYHIAFDDEGSFGWTEKTSDEYYKSGTAGATIEILTATDPLKYDVGYFRSGLDSELMDLIRDAYITLAGNGDDTYGPTVGYNGYKVIDNVQAEIYDKFEQVLG